MALVEEEDAEDAKWLSGDFDLEVTLNGEVLVCTALTIVLPLEEIDRRIGVAIEAAANSKQMWLESLPEWQRKFEKAWESAARHLKARGLWDKRLHALFLQHAHKLQGLFAQRCAMPPHPLPAAAYGVALTAEQQAELANRQEEDGPWMSIVQWWTLSKAALWPAVSTPCDRKTCLKSAEGCCCARASISFAQADIDSLLPAFPWRKGAPDFWTLAHAGPTQQELLSGSDCIGFDAFMAIIVILSQKLRPKEKLHKATDLLIKELIKVMPKPEPVRLRAQLQEGEVAEVMANLTMPVLTVYERWACADAGGSSDNLLSCNEIDKLLRSAALMGPQLTIHVVKAQMVKSLFDMPPKLRWDDRMESIELVFSEFVEFLTRCSEERYRGSGTTASRLDRFMKILMGAELMIDNKDHGFQSAEAVAEAAKAAEAAAAAAAEAAGGERERTEVVAGEASAGVADATGVVAAPPPPPKAVEALAGGMAEMLLSRGGSGT